MCVSVCVCVRVCGGGRGCLSLTFLSACDFSRMIVSLFLFSCNTVFAQVDKYHTKANEEEEDVQHHAVLFVYN